MCKAFEDLIKIMLEERTAEIEEKAAKRNEELATNMLLKGKYSIEEICEFSTLSKEEVEKLAKNLPVNA